MAHARRRFVELHLANKSSLAAAAMEFIGQLCGIEREVRDLPAQDRLRERRTRAAPVAQALHKWLLEFRPKVPEGSATRQGHGQQPEPLGGAHALPRRPRLAHRQQFRRTADQTLGHGTQELALRWDAARRAAGGSHHEPHPDGQA